MNDNENADQREAGRQMPNRLVPRVNRVNGAPAPMTGMPVVELHPEFAAKILAHSEGSISFFAFDVMRSTSSGRAIAKSPNSLRAAIEPWSRVPAAASSRAWAIARTRLSTAGYGLTELTLDASLYVVPQRPGPVSRRSSEHWQLIRPSFQRLDAFDRGSIRDAGGRHGLGKSTISSAAKLRLFEPRRFCRTESAFRVGSGNGSGAAADRSRSQRIDAFARSPVRR